MSSVTDYTVANVSIIINYNTYPFGNSYLENQKSIEVKKMTALSFQLQKSLKILFHFAISVECGHFGKLQDTTLTMNHL